MLNNNMHPSVNKQYNIFGLIVAFCDYGVDYYWKEREGYLFTSGKHHICWRIVDKNYIFDIRFGVKLGGKDWYRFPRWWSKLWNRF